MAAGLTDLVDTSVLTRLREPAIAAVIEPLLAAGKLGRARISDLEVGNQARNVREWNGYLAALDEFGVVEVEAQHFHRAMEVQRRLASRSQRGRKIPDLLIAAVAEVSGLRVLHYDHDFEIIATITGQRAEWVVPAGTVN